MVLADENARYGKRSDATSRMDLAHVLGGWIKRQHR
jgi:hypothetical protein